MSKKYSLKMQKKNTELSHKHKKHKKCRHGTGPAGKRKKMGKNRLCERAFNESVVWKVPCVKKCCLKELKELWVIMLGEPQRYQVPHLSQGTQKTTCSETRQKRETGCQDRRIRRKGAEERATSSKHQQNETSETSTPQVQGRTLIAPCPGSGNGAANSQCRKCQAPATFLGSIDVTKCHTPATQK